jgi:putative lipase involved disintegration of autophagic bodies
MQVIKPTKVETTYRHKETGELFKERKDWEAKGYKEEDMAQDVNVVMPSLTDVTVRWTYRFKTRWFY